ncbi:MAG TPA: S26 family signal peptidase [Flavobacteriales bacterium]|nr:S26 family signal peptidase [Flavobacteriales bacterium]
MGIEWIILLLLFVEYSIFLPKVFVKAGEEPWKGYIPIYNLLVMLKVMKKPWWWILFLLAPGVNLLMLMAMNLELARAFGRFETGDTLLAIFLPHFAIPKIALKPEIQYVGPTDWKKEKDREVRKVSDMIVLALVSVGIFNVLIALYKMVGAKDKPGHKTIVKEWGDALLFAIVAASIIRAFFLEAFKIPTPSMEKNLLVGDFLFVSKISYGPKIPQTPVAFPFVHHTLPLIETKSYLNIFELPYYRLPGLGSVQRNDVVVFNFPAGDSVQLDKQNETYYQIVTDNAFRMFVMANVDRFRKESHKKLLREFYEKKEIYQRTYRNKLIEEGNLTHRPVDKEDHYIKRCVALPGDVVEIRNRELFINGKQSGNTPKMEFNYRVKMQEPIMDQDQEMRYKGLLKDNLDMAGSDLHLFAYGIKDAMVTVPNDKVEDAKKSFVLFEPIINGLGSHDTLMNLADYINDPVNFNHFYQYYPVFPNSPDYDWSNDNFGPLTIPKEGQTVKLDLKNLAIYRRIIDVYEHNDLRVKNNDIYINGKKAGTYTFKQNYYWLMGDNRQNSLDSRYWGFVPEDHVVGKGVLVWFSSDPEGGVRWNRIFKLIK